MLPFSMHFTRNALILILLHSCQQSKTIISYLSENWSNMNIMCLEEISPQNRSTERMHSRRNMLLFFNVLFVCVKFKVMHFCAYISTNCVHTFILYWFIFCVFACRRVCMVSNWNRNWKQNKEEKKTDDNEDYLKLIIWFFLSTQSN